MGDAAFYAVADVHVANFKDGGGELVNGLNMRCRRTLKVLSAAAKIAGNSPLFVLGDLFDADKPSPQIIAAAARALRLGEGPRILLLGNHDASSVRSRGDSALAPLAVHPNVTVVDEEPVAISVGHKYDPTVVWCVPYGYNVLETSPPSSCAACVIHAGLKDEDTPPWLADSTSAVAVSDLLAWADAHSIKHVLAGDWHEHKTWSDGRVQQVGALVPTGWNNPGIPQYGSLLKYANGGVERSALPGPRFVSCDSHAAAAKLLARQSSNDLFVRVSAARDTADDASLEDLGATYVEYRSAALGAQGQVALAGSDARSVDSLERALDVWLGKQGLDPATRAVVDSELRRRLKL